MTAVLKWVLDLLAGWVATRMAKKGDGPATFSWCCACGSFEISNGEVTIKCGCAE